MLEAYAQFERLHCGIYHDSWQAQTVSKLAAQMATQAGFSRKESRFLAQVALLHNADERLCVATKEQKPLLCPQVHNTLDWMLANREALCRHFCWTKHSFHTACALISRTCNPFDAEPRLVGENFYGKSPVELSAHFLALLEPVARENALKMGLILRFCDQIANYTGNQKRVCHAVNGLVKELQATGVQTTSEALKIGSFLSSVGQDLSFDRTLALRLGISRDALLGREQLLALLPAAVRRRLDANIEALSKSTLAA